MASSFMKEMKAAAPKTKVK